MQIVKEYIAGITPQNLSLLPHDNWEAIRLGANGRGFVSDAIMNAYAIREQYIARVGFPIYTEETVATLVKFLKDKRVFDVGSGSGFLSAVLGINFIEVRAIDSDITTYSSGKRKNGSNWDYIYRKDVSSDAVDYLKTANKHGIPPDVIIMCWPDYQKTFARDILKAMKPNQILIYQGEGSWGCTGDEEFHDMLNNPKIVTELDYMSEKLNSTHAQFEGIHDYWYVYKKV